MTVSTIRQIKQQIQQLTNGDTDNQLPSFWFTDWLLYVIDKPAIALMTDEDYQLTDSEIARFNDGVNNNNRYIITRYYNNKRVLGLNNNNYSPCGKDAGDLITCTIIPRTTIAGVDLDVEGVMMTTRGVEFNNNNNQCVITAHYNKVTVIIRSIW